MELALHSFASYSFVPELGTSYIVSNIQTMIKSIHTTEYQILTDWLKAARVKQGLTMRDLALKLEVPHSFIGKVEQCERRIDVIEYIHYCKALEVSPVEGFQLLLS